MTLFEETLKSRSYSTQEDIREKKEDQAKEDASMSNIFVGGVKESFFAGAYREATSYLTDAEAGFRASDHFTAEVAKTVPEPYRAEVLDSHSQEEYDYKLGTAMEYKQWASDLQNAGWQGYIPLIAGSILGDPSTYIGVGLAGSAYRVAKGTKLAKTIQSMKIAMGETLMDEALSKTVTPHKTWGDVAVGTLTAGAFVSGVSVGMNSIRKGYGSMGKLKTQASTLLHKSADEQEASKVKNAVAETMKDKGYVKDPESLYEEDLLNEAVEGVQQFGELTVRNTHLETEISNIETQLAEQRFKPEETVPIIEDLDVRKTELLQNQEMVDQLMAVPQMQAMSAGPNMYQAQLWKTSDSEAVKEAMATKLGKQVDKVAEKIRSKIQEDLDDIEVTNFANELQGATAPFGLTMGHKLLTSKEPIIAEAAYRLVEYAPGFKGQFSRGYNAAGYRSRHHRYFDHLWKGTTRASMLKYRKLSGVHKLNVAAREGSKLEFYRKVREYSEMMRRPELHEGQIPKKGADPLTDLVIDTAESMKKVRDEMYGTANEYGAEGFDKGRRDWSLAQQWVPAAIHKAAKKYGIETVDEVLYKGIRQVMDEAVGENAIAKLDQLARKQAQAIRRRMMDSYTNVEGFTSDILGSKNDKLLNQTMRDISLSPEDMETFWRAVDLTRKGDPTKSVIEMNLNTTHNGLKVMDLLEQDLGKQMHREVTNMSGKIALARVGFKTEKDWTEMIQRAQQAGVNRGIDKDALRQDIQKLQNIRKLLLGESLELDPVSTNAKVVRTLRDLTQLSMLNFAGITQIAEFGRVAGRIGVVSLIKNMAGLRSLIKRYDPKEIDKLIREGMHPDDAKRLLGKKHDEMLRDIEESGYGSIGDDHILNSTVFRRDATNDMLIDDSWTPDQISIFTNLLPKLKEVQGFVSGMNYIKRMQDVVQMKGAAQKITKAVMKDTLSPGEIRRLVDIGLDVPMLGRIKKMLIQHNWNPKGSMRMQYWTDTEATEAMHLALQRAAESDIQRVAIGETHQWTHSTWGKLFSQFRTFSLGAIEKQLMHDARFADSQAFLTMMWSMMFGSAVYVSKTFLHAAGKDESEAYLDERLSTLKIAKGGLALMGQLPLLQEASRIAGVLDEDFDVLRYTDQRGTGIRSTPDFKMRNLAPGAAFVEQGGKSIFDMYKAMTSDEFDISSKQFRDFMSLAPLMRNPLSTWALSAASDEFPEEH